MFDQPPEGWEVNIEAKEVYKRTLWGTVKWVPNDYTLRTQILALFHDLPTAGHFGRDKTLDAIRQRWEWPNLAKDVTDYVRSCATCQMTKPWKTASQGVCLPITAEYPWQIIGVDFLSGFPESPKGNTDCLVVIDKFTKWVCAVPCRQNPTAQETAQLLIRGVFQTFGLPEAVISDRGSQFTSQTWDEVLRTLRVNSRLATPRHAQTNGQVERANAILKRRLIAAVTEDSTLWEEALPFATLAINCSVQRATGISPFKANFFREPRTPQNVIGTYLGTSLQSLALVEETLAQMRDNIVQAAEKMKEQKEASLTGHTYEVGEQVWVNARVFTGQAGPPKLHCAFYGPYRIIAKVNDNAYEISGLPATVHQTQNITELRPFVESPERFNTRPRQPIPEPTIVDGEEEWEVEEIRAFRRRGSHIAGATTSEDG